jgi:hypothetical protein
LSPATGWRDGPDRAIGIGAARFLNISLYGTTDARACCHAGGCIRESCLWGNRRGSALSRELDLTRRTIAANWIVTC